MPKTLPVVRLSERSSVREWENAFSNYGFTIIEEHGVDADLGNRLYNLSKVFFDQTIQDKLKSVESKTYGDGGFVPMGVESVDNDSPVDYVESLVFRFDGDDRLLNRNLRVDASLLTAVRAYVKAIRILLIRIVEISSLALGVEPTEFESCGYGRRSLLSVRIAYYPVQESPPVAGQLRYGAHTDYECFTILRQDSVPGLQVLMDNVWTDVPPTPTGLVINSGDLLHRWTNGKWKSNLHRVVNPVSSGDRLSIVVFSSPSPKATIKPILLDGETCRFDPVVAGDWIDLRLAQSNAKEFTL